MTTQVLRYRAFTVNGRGGNFAGVVLDARGLDGTDMQAIAADVGYSETAFLVARPDEPNVYDVRYFSPQREVPFGGHATIASAVALAELSPAAELILHTPAGFISVTTLYNDSGDIVAELTSVAPRVSEPQPDLVAAVLHALRWAPEDLDSDYPVRLANAGSQHLVLVTKTRQRLADLNYDLDALAKLMRDHGLVTVHLVWSESKKRYHARDLFAGSGVVEDPATGASAAAFGGYLRELGLIRENASFTIQGVDLGRPCEIHVSVIGGEPGVRVSGTSHRIDS
jgi:PhzF family phenazine biosynthesis protein